MNQRPIKFRVWDGKKMYYPSILTIDTANNFVTFPWMGKDIFVKGLDNLQKFTGLKDRDKEIYEGDTIRYRIGHRKFATYTVVFEDGAFFMKSEKWGKIYLNCVDKRAVVGNIFETES